MKTWFKSTAPQRNHDGQGLPVPAGRRCRRHLQFVWDEFVTGINRQVQIDGRRRTATRAATRRTLIERSSICAWRSDPFITEALWQVALTGIPRCRSHWS
jgi:hypothetical protein